MSKPTRRVKRRCFSPSVSVMVFSRRKKPAQGGQGSSMANVRVKALAAGLAADAVRDAIPSGVDLAEAELFRPEDRAAVVRELERIADELLAESLRLEAL